jgi:hypothetical protein
MTRSRATAKQAGTRMETATAEHLAAHVDDRIERRRLTGAKDRGDIGGVRTIRGARVVVEVKDYNGSVQVKPWLDQAEVEAGNDDAPHGVVVFKRSRVSYSNPGEQGVLMTLDTLIWLLHGGPDRDDYLSVDSHTRTVVRE